MKLVVARRPGAPVVNMTMLVNSGMPTDFAAIPPGTATLAMDLLAEATTSRSRDQLVEQLGSLGASVGALGWGAEGSAIILSALKPALRPSLSVFSDVVMHPAFAQSDLERLRSQTLARIGAERKEAGATARRILPRLIFGSDNAYGQTVTEASVKSIGRAGIVSFYDRWFHPNNATLVVAGDTSLGEVRPMVESAFGGWKGGTIPQTFTPTAQPPTKSFIYLVDRPGAPQSAIQAGVVAPPRLEGDDVARLVFNKVFGGGFTSRLNMKLREEKGWAYGASTGIQGGKGSRLFVASASVQSDKTSDAMLETAALLKGIVTENPVTADELARAKDALALGLSSDWSTSDGIMRYVANQVSSGLPEDYFDRYPSAVLNERLEAVNAAGNSLLSGRAITWVVVGDRAKIEDKLRALGLGEVVVIDADGKIAR
jgi:zinc protease